MLVGGFSHPDPLLSRDAKQAVQHLALKKEKKKDKSMQIEKKEKLRVVVTASNKNSNCSRDTAV